MGFEETELAFMIEGLEGDVDSIEDTDNVDPQEDAGGSVETAERLALKVIPPTIFSPKLGKLARSNPVSSVPSMLSKPPWYLSRLPLTSLTLRTMIKTAYDSRKRTN